MKEEKRIEYPKLEPEIVVPAAIDHLLFGGFRRIDGHFERQKIRFKFSAYRVKEMIRIDVQEAPRVPK